MSYSKRDPMQEGQTYQSNHWGSVTVTDYLNAKQVTCQFQNTGNVGVFHAQMIRKGLIVDHAERRRVAEQREIGRKARAEKNLHDATEAAKQRSAASIEGRVFESLHCGPFEVSYYKNTNNVTVRFINTGFETVTTKAYLLASTNPRIRDPLAPTVFGVGFQGIGRHEGYEKTVETRPHAIWRAMLRRCYGSEDRPAYADVTVCDEWLNYQAFADWYERNHPGTHGLELDKDIKVPGNRVYGPHACQFVTKEQNNDHRRKSLI